ncbi:type IV pilus twitching motility protein PilT [Pedosphaera parvula]|uniref:Type II secretion system protein E n=1 Tax=Pedosphaera parvula (strain Ellin514) TaxID=320771 RepID=B9XSZ5_PEDPL|nr:ATPase, T2SS/T4P/T4SS family [Pedosphaera parvula]EEF57030.1 type II secretion system protein E [Pedosphaera parvula Ellin514]
MDLYSLIATAKANGASDLHLEPTLPAAIRVRGSLRTVGAPIAGKALLDAAQEIIGVDAWPLFLERRSYDLSKSIQGVRCRINVLQTSRGIGMAVRLLTSFQATIEKLNLHPDFKKLTNHSNGLILISGPTGSGKSSTMAAFIQEINLAETRHILTVESPIEYLFKPHRGYIRQREVGRDTPSFEQALMDAMREDPDVLMVGEMRDPETMRLTLNVAETGHLVLATAHSGSTIEALQRMVAAFPPEMQNNVCAQLADCLVVAICQRLQYRADLKLQVPECEVLIPTIPVKNFIRRGEFFKIMSAMEIGAEQGMWTYQRYRTWLDSRKNWYLPDQEREAEETAEVVPDTVIARMASPAPKAGISSATPEAPAATPAKKAKENLIEIEPVEGGLDAIMSKLKPK